MLPKFSKNLYTKEEFKMLELVHSMYLDADGDLEASSRDGTGPGCMEYFRKNIWRNTLLKQLKDLVLLECPQCKETSPLEEFIDVHDCFLDGKVCYECSKQGPDIGESIVEHLKDSMTS
jgi:hypothetical protein